MPPDLSLIARSEGPDYIYRFLKTFYSDPSRPTRQRQSGVSGCRDAGGAVRPGGRQGRGAWARPRHSITSQTISPGNLTAEQFDGFVRDTVNFLDYVGDPAQVERRSIGLWVVLFLLLLSAFAWALKKEYWKDVH